MTSINPKLIEVLSKIFKPGSDYGLYITTSSYSINVVVIAPKYMYAGNSDYIRINCLDELDNPIMQKIMTRTFESDEGLEFIDYEFDEPYLLDLISCMPNLTYLKYKSEIWFNKEIPNIKVVDFTNLDWCLINRAAKIFTDARDIIMSAPCAEIIYYCNFEGYKSLKTVHITEISDGYLIKRYYLLESIKDWKSKPKVDKLYVENDACEYSLNDWRSLVGHMFNEIEVEPRLINAPDKLNCQA